MAVIDVCRRRGDAWCVMIDGQFVSDHATHEAARYRPPGIRSHLSARLPGVSTGADGETDWCTEHGVPWIALTDAWAADSSLGLRSWIEEHWPNEGDR